jgi:hypothetical protein
MRATSTARVIRALALALSLAVVASTDLSAHRRDEYLQAARFAIAPGRVEVQLDLTPGIAVAETVIAEIDRNRDGSFSPDEKQAYVGRVFGDIELAVDGQPVQLQAVAARFPDLDAFRRGEGTIALQSTADLPHLSAGPHQLSYRNTHRRDISVYLANALVPDNVQVSVNAQLRDADQHDLTIQYVLRDGLGTSFARVWLLGCLAAAGVWVLLLRRLI